MAKKHLILAACAAVTLSFVGDMQANPFARLGSRMGAFRTSFMTRMQPVKAQFSATRSNIAAATKGKLKPFAKMVGAGWLAIVGGAYLSSELNAQAYQDSCKASCLTSLNGLKKATAQQMALKEYLRDRNMAFSCLHQNLEITRKVFSKTENRHFLIKLLDRLVNKPKEQQPAQYNVVLAGSEAFEGKPFEGQTRMMENALTQAKTALDINNCQLMLDNLNMPKKQQ